MTIRKLVPGLLVAGLFTAGCANVRVYDLPKVQNHVSEAVGESEALVGKAQADFQTKKTLVENLRKMNAPAFRQTEATLRAHLQVMEEALTTMNLRRRQMMTAKSDIVGMAYNHRQIDSSQKEYPQLDETVKQFESATAEINSAMATYSRESNALADTANSKKLHYSFDPAEFQKRIQVGIKAAQDNSAAMQEELDRDQDLLNRGADPNTAAVQQKMLSDMQTLAQSYTDRAQRFAQIAKEVNAQTDGGKVTSLDPSWGSVQKLVGEFEKVVQDLARLNGKFQADVDGFRNAFKRVR